MLMPMLSFSLTLKPLVPRNKWKWKKLLCKSFISSSKNQTDIIRKGTETGKETIGSRGTELASFSSPHHYDREQRRGRAFLICSSHHYHNQREREREKDVRGRLRVGIKVEVEDTSGKTYGSDSIQSRIKLLSMLTLNQHSTLLHSTPKTT